MFLKQRLELINNIKQSLFLHSIFLQSMFVVVLYEEEDQNLSNQPQVHPMSKLCLQQSHVVGKLTLMETQRCQ